MKKSLIALAVAGAVSAPAFAASSNVDIYGAARISVNSQNGNRGISVSDQTSRIGIKGSEDLGGGLKAVFQWESQLNNMDGTAAPVAGTNTIGLSTGTQANTTMRNTFVGLSGGFGTVVAGIHDSPYKLAGSADIFADTAADSQRATTGIIGRNGFDTRANNATAYISPDFSGFHFAIAGFAAEHQVAGGAHNLWDAQSLALVYGNGPLKVTYGHESYSKKTGIALGVAAADSAKVGDKFNIGYSFGDIGVGYTYERSEPTFISSAKKDTAHLASVTYGMGPIVLGLQYGKFDDKNNTGAADLGVSRTTVGAYYNLSKRTQSYVAYNNDNPAATGAADTNTWTLGLNHSF